MKNRLIQLYRANAKADGFFRLEASDGGPVIYLYTLIGKGYDWDTGEIVGVSDMEFIQALAECRNAPVTHLRINSPGGDVFQCKGMQTAMMQHPGEIMAHIDGIAASAAASLTPYATSVEMSAGSFMMIHKSWAFAAGNADDMTRLAGMLNQIDISIAQDYVRKTGIEESEVMDMMSKTTYLNAKTAQEKGFCDSICEPDQKVENRFDLSVYGSVPDELKFKKPAEPPKPPKPAKPVRNYDRELVERRLALLERLG
jgi:ATP-dependent Clp protease, protease subunit